MLHRGLIFRIGKVDRFPSGMISGYPQPILIGLYSIASGLNLVADFIDHDLKQWKHSLLDHWLLPDEAAAALTISLCPVDWPDKLVWRLTPSGLYTVCSGVWLAKQI